MKQLFNSFRLGSRMTGLVFACLFAAIGGFYVLSTHAAYTPFEAQINVTNSNGQVLDGASVGVKANNGTGCQSTNEVSGHITVSCSSGGGAPSFVITDIVRSGYQVTSGSYVKVGSVLSTSPGGPTTTTTYSLIMELIPQSSPPPSPPPPSSPPPSSTSTGTSGTTTHTSSGSTVKVVPSPSTSSTDTTSNVQPATNDTSGDLTGDSNSNDLNVPKDSKSIITSDDQLVKVTFPAGTFDNDAFCSVDKVDGSPLPSKVSDQIGPYALNCADVDGNLLDKLNQAATVEITVSGKGKHIAYVNDNKWSTIGSSQSGQTISFKLAKNELFSTAVKKSTSPLIIIIDIGAIVLFLLIIGFIIHLIRRRRQLDAPPTAGYYDQNYPSS